MPVRQPYAGVEFIPRTGIYEFGYSSEIPLKLLEGKEGTSHILFLCVYESPAVVRGPTKASSFPIRELLLFISIQLSLLGPNQTSPQFLGDRSLEGHNWFSNQLKGHGNERNFSIFFLLLDPYRRNLTQKSFSIL